MDSLNWAWTWRRLARCGGGFAFPCLDWSERRAHLGGALGRGGAGLALKRNWVQRDLDSRAPLLTCARTPTMEKEFGIRNGVIESE